jgi:peptidoglycan/xylan/chitin deacetylase (PgdA/CDA1 family)
MLGVGGAAVGGGLTGSAVESAATSASRQAVREDGMYAAGPRGQQHVLWSVDTTRRVAALTFDDGPTPVFTPPVLDVLHDAGVPATFFMIGKLVSQYPSIARQVAAAGHEVGNHSWSHLSAATASDRTNVTEIDKASDVIASVTGTTPRWYRPPRGMLVGAAVRRAFERDQGVAMWSVTRGPARLADSDVAGVRQHLIESVHPGAVVDLHDGVGASAFDGVSGYSASLTRRRQAEIAALPDVLAAWKAAGYALVTLSELNAN